MLKIHADNERCMGTGNCVLRNGDVFDQSDETGLVVLLKEDIGPADEPTVKRAVDQCPAKALSLD